jgi:hypothetical protein
MQLRVARLCLDCEELHVAASCPVCASERYAFLSTWLPSEERRRWRTPATQSEEAAPRPIRALRRVLARWLGVPEPVQRYSGPRTRASDRVPNLDFDTQAGAPEERAAGVHEASDRYNTI